jgi:DNA-binding GntR family transcriptional regulator
MAERTQSGQARTELTFRIQTDAEMKDEEIRQLREVREIFETSAFRLACERATGAQRARIAEACDDFESFVTKGYPTAAHVADLRLHHLLVEAAGNARLAQLY